MGLFGSKYPSTEKIEKEEKRLRDLYREVLETSGSAELKEYLALDKIVNTDEFQIEKKRIINLKFNRTKEHEALNAFNKLKKDRKLKKYLLIEGSQELSDYENFKSSDAYSQINDKKERKKSSTLAKFFKFENSKAFLIYKSIKQSPLPKEFQALKERVNSKDFLDFKAFCENKKRWESTPEYDSERKLEALRSNTKIANYVNYNDSDVFDEFKNYEITFEDDFSHSDLNKSKWHTSFFWAEKYGKGNYSQSNQNQGYIGSKNIGVIGSKLTVSTRRDAHSARVWDSKKGFIMKDVDYSSGVISSGTSFSQKGGIFKIKLKTNGKYPIGHKVMLSSEKNDQQITIFKTLGKRKSFVGYSFLKEGKLDASHALIKSYRSNKGYYILSLEWDTNILVWKLNGVKVYSCHAPKELNDLHFTSYSFVDKSKKKTDSGSLVFDWVKAYKKIGD